MWTLDFEDNIIQDNVGRSPLQLHGALTNFTIFAFKLLVRRCRTRTRIAEDAPIVLR